MFTWYFVSFLLFNLYYGFLAWREPRVPPLQVECFCELLTGVVWSGSGKAIVKLEQ